MSDRKDIKKVKTKKAVKKPLKAIAKPKSSRSRKPYDTVGSDGLSVNDKEMKYRKPKALTEAEIDQLLLEEMIDGIKKNGIKPVPEERIMKLLKK